MSSGDETHCLHSSSSYGLIALSYPTVKQRETLSLRMHMCLLHCAWKPYGMMHATDNVVNSNAAVQKCCLLQILMINVDVQRLNRAQATLALTHILYI